MVTITLSTVSVVTAIFVFRLNDKRASPVPYFVRVVVFRYLARVVCVRLTETGSTSTLYSRASSPSCTANDTAVYAAAGSTNADKRDVKQASTSADCSCQLRPTVDSLLCELRKVTILGLDFFSLFIHSSFILACFSPSCQTERLEAVQHRDLRIIFLLFLIHLVSYYLRTGWYFVSSARRVDLSKRFFRNICKPDKCLHYLVPPPRDLAVTSRPRKPVYPRPSLRTKRYCSAVSYALLNFQ